MQHHERQMTMSDDGQPATIPEVVARASRRRDVRAAQEPLLEVKCLVDDGHSVGPGESGEVLVRGPCVICGYSDDPQAARAIDADGWTHAEDIGVASCCGRTRPATSRPSRAGAVADLASRRRPLSLTYSQLIAGS